MMKRITLFYNVIPLIIVGYGLVGGTGQAQSPKGTPASPPNIIILLADDLGYGDLSCYGSQSVETPHLDSLAAEGMQFSHFYAGSAVCTPSRASLLTGKYPIRYDIRRHFSDRQEHLPTSATTLPELLQEKGYHTAHIGKWHLGGLRPQDYQARQAGQSANPGPLQHGFDHSLTSIEGAPVRPQLIKDRQLYRRGGKFMVRNDQRAEEDPHHWTEIKVNEAISLVDRYADDERPFFLNLWFDVPHTPYEPAPEPHLSKYEQMGVTGDQLYFRSMVSHLDANIGRLVKHLKETGAYDNTIILFTSDNGPAFQGSPGPFRGGKTDLHEGGIRVPMFVVWPGRVPPNTYSFSPVHMADLLPTFSHVAGIDTDSLVLDGQNRLNTWTNQTFQDRDALFWQMDLYKSFQNQGPKPMPYATAVVVQGQWKLLADSLQPTELFNLAEDHRELYNVLDERPEVAEALANQLRKLMASPRDRTGFVEKGILHENY